MIRAAFSLLLVLLVTACSSVVRRNIDEAACISAGGRIERRGILGLEMCVTPYPDANAQCADSSECNGRCLLDIDAVDIPPAVGAAASGTCEADNATFGCFMEIVAGHARSGVCID